MYKNISNKEANQVIQIIYTFCKNVFSSLLLISDKFFSVKLLSPLTKMTTNLNIKKY